MKEWTHTECGALLLTALMVAGATAATAQDEYQLGPKDVLSIVVVGHEELSYREREPITVRPDGKISFPLMSEVDVSGKTAAEVEELIEAALKKRYRHVDVAINVVRPRPKRIYVLGEVRQPGPFDLENEDIGVREAIALAGGLTPQASRRKCYLYGRDSEPMPIDLAVMLSDTDNGDEPRLAPGDALFVQKKNVVTVAGEVEMPGVYEMEDDARVVDAIAAAKGLTPLSDRQQARLLRADHKNDTIELAVALATPASDANALLRDGDTLVINETHNEVYVIGAVEQPGGFYAADGLTAAQALALAGGAKEEAELAHVKLLRSGQQPQILDLRPLVERTPATGLEQFASTGDEVVLERGDTLVVPERFERVLVLGSVREPGAYPIEPGDRVTDALAAAGGPIPKQSRTGRISLMRREDERVTRYKIDLRKLKDGRNPSQDQLVQHGDLIFVPGAKTSLQDSMWTLYTGVGAARFLTDIFD